MSEVLNFVDIEFPKVIDSSMAATAMHCRRKFYWQYVRYFIPIGINIHLHAGGAYAKALETFRRSFYGEQLSFEESRAKAFIALTKIYGEINPDENETAKQWINIVYAFIFYLYYYPPQHDPLIPLIVDGKPFIEFSFAIPLPAKHPVSNDPLIFGGRADMVAKFYETPFIVDDKTTKQMGPAWADQWIMRGQFTGYSWAADVYGHKTAGAIIRGVSIQKTQNKHLQVPVYRSEWQIERWKNNLFQLVNHLIWCFENNHWPTDGEFNDSCTSYGKCPYMQLCTSPEPESWITGNYQKHKWSPLEAERD